MRDILLFPAIFLTMSTANAPLDPYTAQAEENNTNLSLQEKINREPHNVFLLGGDLIFS